MKVVRGGESRSGEWRRSVVVVAEVVNWEC